MKKLSRSFALFFLTVALVLGGGDLFAQAKWVPDSLSVQVPMIVTKHFSSNVPGSTYDYGSTEKMLLNIALSGYLISFTRVGDSINILFGEPGTPFRQTTINFIIDTINKKLINFYCGYDEGIYYYQVKFFAEFSPIKYKQIGDSILIVSDSGKLCRQSFDTANYNVAINEQRGPGYYVREDDHMDSVLLTDTASFNYSLKFLLIKPINSIPQSSLNQQKLIISTSLPDHSIHFSFPSCDHAQRMTIYDILGREVSRIEIPAGSSSYAMSSVGYPRDTFFARVGSSGAKFIVY